jgi:DNA-binding response OmpR family regulator
MPQMKPCILVIDDNEQTLILLQAILEKENYRVVTADSAKTAASVLENETVDLVLLDVMMPVLDGYALCRQIRARSMLPIIILTALESDEYIARGLDAGADDYITKPVSSTVLLARVRAVLRRSKK